ncbi:MAG TPA: hypothetical protein VM865_08615, partial [Acidobacteriaceae bacterium]|nr:hypothetical protein [Acidobacteriaceae bacterium]
MERLRWGLLASAVLLVAVLASMLGYARYRAIKAWRQIVAHSGATLSHDTNGFTYSQAVKGRTVFTVHAAKAIPEGDGRYSLHDAVLVLYGPNGGRADRISGAEFDYDEKAGVARALGEVHIDLQAPAGLAGVAAAKGVQGPGANGAANGVGGNGASGAAPGAAPAAAPAAAPGGAAGRGWELESGMESPGTIHVRTSGLVYMHKLGVAATKEEVEIQYGDFRGYARGAEFNSEESVVHLLAEVRAETTARGQAVALRASKADLDRNENVVRLAGPVVRSGGREGRAAAAVVRIRKDGTVEQVQASGQVMLAAGTQRLTAARMEAALSGQSMLQRAEFAGGVEVDDSSAERPVHGVARTLTVACNGAGSPTGAVAEGQVAVEMDDRAGGGEGVLHRRMGGDRMVVSLRTKTHGEATEVSRV